MAPFARRRLWCICAAVSVGSQCVVARFARSHLWGICAAVSLGSQCVVARFARKHLMGICATVSVGSQYGLTRFARRHLLWGIFAAVSVGSQCVVTRCIMSTAVDTMPPAVSTHDCVLYCTHTRIESHKRCPRALTRTCVAGLLYSPVRPLFDVKVFRVLQRAINTSKSGPNVSLAPIDPSET